VGHLLSVADGVNLGAIESELNDDVNLAAMCESCNLGMGWRSVSPATYARILLHLIRAASRTSRGTGIAYSVDEALADIETAQL
jgi:hypothetical protein